MGPAEAPPPGNDNRRNETGEGDDDRKNVGQVKTDRRLFSDPRQSGVVWRRRGRINRRGRRNGHVGIVQRYFSR
jgi:hypothetical protein